MSRDSRSFRSRSPHQRRERSRSPLPAKTKRSKSPRPCLSSSSSSSSVYSFLRPKLDHIRDRTPSPPPPIQDILAAKYGTSAAHFRCHANVSQEFESKHFRFPYKAWEFDKAPKEVKEEFNCGGDEHMILFVAHGVHHDTPGNETFGPNTDKFTVPSGTVYVGYH